MKKLTQPEIILKLLREFPEQWFHSYELRGRSTPWGFCGHQADRRAREMAEQGTIEVRHDGKYAMYRAKPPVKMTKVFAVLPDGNRELIRVDKEY